MSGFTEAKFQSLPLVQQHKKASEAVRALYEGRAVDAGPYQQMRSWLGLEPLSLSCEELANAYHQHLRASGRGIREHHLLPNVRNQDRKEKGTPLPYSLYLDQIRSAHNVGSILRSAEAFNIERIYFSPDTPFPSHPQVQKTSMGAWEWIEWEVVEELPGPLFALETCEGAIPLESFDCPRGGVLALGNEEFGCSRGVLEEAEGLVEIPLLGRKNSLNVANVCAITLYHLSLNGLFVKKAWEDDKPDSVSGNHSSRGPVTRTLKRSRGRHQRKHLASPPCSG